MLRRVLAYCVIALFIVGLLIQLNSYLSLVSIYHDPALGDEQVTVITQQHYQRDNNTLLIYISVLIAGMLTLMFRSWFQSFKYNRSKLLGQFWKPKTTYLERIVGYQKQLLFGATVSLLDLFKIGLLVSINILLLLGTASGTVQHDDPHGGFEEYNLYLQSLSNKAAQLAVTNIAFSVLLSAKLSILQQHFYQLSDTLRWHAWFGRIAFFQILYHAMHQIQHSYNKTDHDLLTALTYNARHTTGVLMLIALCSLAFGSHSLIRLVCYRLFRVLHMVGFAVLIVCGCFHHWTFYVFYITVLLFWVVDQLDRSYSIEMLLTEALPGDVVKVQCSIPYSMKQGLIPGQFAFISLSPSWWSAAVHSHPFSISRVDMDSGNDDAEDDQGENSHSLLDRHGHSVFTFYIKATGRHTKDLYDMAQSSSKYMKARISKPLGRPYVNDSGAEFGDFEAVVLVAEGMGITPWISVLQYMEQKQHAVKTQSIDIIWSIHSIDTFYAFEKEFEQFSSSIQLDLNIKVFITGPSDPEENYSIPTNLSYISFITSNRPNYSQMLHESHKDKYTAVGACAHDATLVQLNNLCLRYSWAIKKEKFEL